MNEIPVVAVPGPSGITGLIAVFLPLTSYFMDFCLARGAAKAFSKKWPIGDTNMVSPSVPKSDLREYIWLYGDRPVVSFVGI